MKLHTAIHSRQKQLLRKLLQAYQPVSVQSLAEELKVSVRTVQREMASLESVLGLYNLKLVKKIGAGIMLEGSLEDINELRQDLEASHVQAIYSPEERQQGLIRELLLATVSYTHLTLPTKA